MIEKQIKYLGPGQLFLKKEEKMFWDPESNKLVGKYPKYMRCKQLPQKLNDNKVCICIDTESGFVECVPPELTVIVLSQFDQSKPLPIMATIHPISLRYVIVKIIFKETEVLFSRMLKGEKIEDLLKEVED